MQQHSYSKTCAFNSLNDIQNKNVTIMGLGLNGGGEACVRFFLNKGANVLVTDMKSEAQLKPTIDSILSDTSLDTSKLKFRLGEHCIEDFKNADCVIKNPAVKYEGNEFLKVAKNIETDLSIFLRFTDCPIIAVTGSKGKSSTVSAIYYGLKKAGYNAFLGGNITVSPLSFIDKVNKDTPVVIEFSSWQLADLRGRGLLKPKISIISKIVIDHQNWYDNMEDYVQDKRLIYANQDKDDYSIFDYGLDPIGSKPDTNLHPDIKTWGDLFSKESNAKVLRYNLPDFSENNQTEQNYYGASLINNADGSFEGKVFLEGMAEPKTILKELRVPGMHMRINVLNAALVLYLMGVQEDKINDIYKVWEGLEHRLQYFHSYKIQDKNFLFYNDSCATVPEATKEASQAFGKSVILLTGGTDKGLELETLSNILKEKGTLDAKNNNQIVPVKDIYLLEGSATQKIIPDLDKNNISYNGPFSSLDDMLLQLKSKMNEYQENLNIIVFSPGATSFGMFANEFDRGNKFVAAVKKHFK